MSDDIEWSAPPQRSGSGVTVLWSARRAALRAKPGEWARFPVKTANAAGSSARSLSGSAVNDGFEFVGRCEGGQGWIYARFVGETDGAGMKRDRSKSTVLGLRGAYSVEAAAEYLSVSARTVNTLIEQGHLATFTPLGMSRATRISLDTLEAYVEASVAASDDSSISAELRSVS